MLKRVEKYRHEMQMFDASNEETVNRIVNLKLPRLKKELNELEQYVKIQGDSPLPFCDFREEVKAIKESIEIAEQRISQALSSDILTLKDEPLVCFLRTGIYW